MPASTAETGAPTAVTSLSIVVPALNEENGIDEMLDRILGQREALKSVGVDELEVIVVDDGSRDATAERVLSHADVRLVRHNVNRGYGAALKTGFSSARGAWLAFLDADGTYPPESFADLCREALESDADIVIGSRMLGTDSEMPLVRRVGNTMFASLLSVVGARRISDSASGMRVFKRSALSRLYPLPDGLDFTPAMSTRALYEEMRMVELPIPYRERVGRSKLNPARDGVRFLRSILWTAALYNPLGIFGSFGALFLLLAGLFAVGPIAFYLTHRQVPEDSIYRIFAILMLSVAGMNVLAFGAASRAIVGLLPGRRERRPLLGRRSRALLAWAGLAMFVVGSAMVTPSILQWLATRSISYHWSWLAAGGTLQLFGLQLVTWFVLITMLTDLLSRPDRADRDLRGVE
ncbi:MAG: glycosyltransferase family 2 protein [Chloroflexi bacterium]|nr:glycosyltransferase family 2 protein [Chloroflexota bacterium]